MAKYKVVVTSSTMQTTQAAMDKLRQQCEVLCWQKPGKVPLDEIKEWLKDAEGLVTTGGTIRVDEELLALAPNLRVVAQTAVGYDNVDVKACTARGIPFGNTPGVLTETVADMAFGLLLCSARRIHEGWDFVRSGLWRPGSKVPVGMDISDGKTLGIIGMGKIGEAVAKRARAFNMKVVYHNRCRRADDKQIGAEYMSFGDLLGKADCIIVLTPLTQETRGMFGREEFARMKPSAFFVNAARGPVVDTEALHDALVNSKIAFAALDVTDPEPLPLDHPLLKLSNILITPHIASATEETRARMAMLAADNLLAGLSGRPLPACVNPEVNYR